LSKNSRRLTQRAGEIVQDHINRGLYNSTVCINKQLQVHYDHIDGLINYIIESLKRDFINISLAQCKRKLIETGDRNESCYYRRTRGSCCKEETLV
jgi:hypothetical protein